MRQTRDFELLTLDRPAELLGALVHPEFLTTVRYEPIFRERLGFATLDLVFENDGQSLVVTGILLDTISLGTLEGPVLVWPRRLPIAPAPADAIGDHVFPWLRTLVRGRIAPDEQIRSYRPSPLFEAARARAFLGAAPYAQTLLTSAPFAYARRFASGADVLVTCAQGYHAAALVGDLANSVRVVPARDTATEENDIARRWYGELPRREAFGPPTLAIVDNIDDPAVRDVPFVVATTAAGTAQTIVVPEPIPLDHLFTFDPADAPEKGRFCVRAANRITRPPRSVVIPAAAGGSGGSICLVLRDDAGYAPDADTDAAAELERRLIAEGLTVTRATGSTDPAIGAADLVHIFGAVWDPHVMSAIAAAKVAARPYVLSLEPIAVPYTRYVEDGLLAALRLGIDLADRRTYLGAYFDGKLQIDEIPFALDNEQIARNDRAFGRACSGAVAILLSPHDDVAVFRRRFPEVRPESVKLAGILVGAEPEEEIVSALVPPCPFMLVHAPLIRRSNVQFVLGALDEAPFPIVVAGQVSDVDLGITLRRISPRDALCLPDPTPALVAALYRQAAVYVDASHRPTGLGRIIRAAQAGAMPLVPHWSPFAALLGSEAIFDGSTFETAANDLRAAMARGDREKAAARLAAHFATFADPYSAFTDVVGTYAAAAAPAVS